MHVQGILLVIYVYVCMRCIRVGACVCNFHLTHISTYIMNIASLKLHTINVHYSHCGLTRITRSNAIK